MVPIRQRLIVGTLWAIIAAVALSLLAGFAWLVWNYPVPTLATYSVIITTALAVSAAIVGPLAIRQYNDDCLQRAREAWKNSLPRVEGRLEED